MSDLTKTPEVEPERESGSFEYSRSVANAKRKQRGIVFLLLDLFAVFSFISIAGKAGSDPSGARHFVKQTIFWTAAYVVGPFVVLPLLVLLTFKVFGRQLFEVLFRYMPPILPLTVSVGIPLVAVSGRSSLAFSEFPSVRFG